MISTAGSATRHAWIDASAGVAGDMLLGALIDAGADLAVVQEAVDAVVPGSVRLTVANVMRCGQRATKLTVEVLTKDLPHRRWATIRESLQAASLASPVRDRALATFARLAEAEAEAHGIPAEEVHFHEVGALDSIADVVGVAAALTDLGVTSVSASAVAVGSGRVRAAHGELPVPVPAVVRLSAGWRVHAGGAGELATPTGMALVTALSTVCEDLPALRVVGSGAGAGTKDFPDRPNITRVIMGEVEPSAATAPATESDAETTSTDSTGTESMSTESTGTESMSVLEANVDDLDPRLWPGVIDRLLQAGAADAWLTPILMKKGRPAHLLSVLSRPELVEVLQQLILTHTSTLGIRCYQVSRIALSRRWYTVDLPRADPPSADPPEAEVAEAGAAGAGAAGAGAAGAGAGVAGAEVRVKVGYDSTGIRQLNPEFADVASVAATYGLPEREVLALAQAAARDAGLVLGAPPPD
ncbi:hypothetical protein MLP_05640 [Microlunatus phosphovorus NM-1]|uniref:Pyridinium-3,5-bisthiocarboxylic acid mononucleotide nickel insertion protein n=1 Tax=Microlunatus phosphovorus (strain ATCC 700054 / DSM 10555 / JCM 9379 / NBRC 101784 / NCIMB 13414 / VKM Ac-1990 / NM-1) TaxID=1032480 RepID=F5XK82_MICPN|nr:nickel pincer cofactor biosynthesis protein LarC [Microlunatus phosphovorus]BAK33578.1 hypothetical protein MLP_05640 [Microlunatus phosphovorus NM-1]